MIIALIIWFPTYHYYTFLCRRMCYPFRVPSYLLSIIRFCHPTFHALYNVIWWSKVCLSLLKSASYIFKSKYTISGVAFSITSSVVKVHFDFIFPTDSFYTLYVMWRHFTTFKSRTNLLNNFRNNPSTQYVYIHRDLQ